MMPSPGDDGVPATMEQFKALIADVQRMSLPLRSAAPWPPNAKQNAVS